MAIRIAVDAGHGSNTAGKRTPPMPKDIDFEKDGIIDVKKGEAIREHWANVGVAYYAAYYLKKYGFDVIKTGWDDLNSRNDEDISLTARQQTIKKAGCLLSTSCHFNAVGDGKTFNSGRGVETFYHAESSLAKDSKALADKVQNRLVNGIKGQKNSAQVNRGIKPGDLAMCNAAAMGTRASILCECAFMTNLEEAYLMGDKNFWKECGHEIAYGIREYLSEKPKTAISAGTATEKEIIWLQIKLHLAGENCVVTGIWDAQTTSALASWQRKQADGKKLTKAFIKLL